MKSSKKFNLVVLFLIIMVMTLTGCGKIKNSSKKEGETKIAIPDKEITETENITENSNDSNNDVVSDDEAFVLGRELYSLATKYYFGDVDYSTEELIENKYYKINNFEEVKDSFTDKGFEQYMQTNGFIKEIDGNYYRIAADRGGDIYHRGNDIEISKKNNDEIIFTSIEKYIIDDSDLDKEDSQITNFEKKENKFIIKKVNGKWKIESFILPL